MPDIAEILDFTHNLLKTLYKEGPSNQAQLAQKLAANKNRLYRFVQILEQRGLIIKTIDPGPPRQTIITLTPKGKCIAQCLTHEQI